jgi:hypothetical protein
MALRLVEEILILESPQRPCAQRFSADEAETYSDPKWKCTLTPFCSVDWSTDIAGPGLVCSDS